MAKGKSAAFILVLALGAVFHVGAQSLLSHDPEQMPQEADMPSTEIKSYDSRDLSLRQLADSSAYIEPLRGTWKFRELASSAQIDPSLIFSADPAAWSDATVPETRTHGAAAVIYRRDFKVPFKWIEREIFVHVGAVSRAYHLYIDGKQAGYHEDSKTPRDFDVTRLVADGQNQVQDGKHQITIVAYAHPASEKLEDQIKEKGCAIEGDCYVFTQPKVRLRDYVIDTRFDPTGSDGLFSFGAIVKSHLLNPKNVTVYYELIAPDGETVTSGKRDSQFKMRNEDTVRFFANIPNVKTWSHESPMLYTVTLKIQHEGRYTEYAAVKIGFRTVGLDEKGLTINGRRFGVRAADYEPVQNIPDLKKELAALKKKGVNMIRVSSFPQPETFYELCDHYGIYVCNQANIDASLSGESRKIGGTPANDPQWEAAYTDRVMNMYFTSKNHPSVVMFSLGKQGGKGLDMYEAYLALKAEEKERPVIYGDAGAEWNTDLVVESRNLKRNPSDTRPSIIFNNAADAGSTTLPSGNITITEGSARGEANIENRHEIANTNNFRIVYTIKQRKKVIARGSLTANVGAGGKGTVGVPLDGLKSGNYTVDISVEHSNVPPELDNGGVIAQHSFPVTIPKIK